VGVTGVHARGVPTGVRARRVCVGDERARDGGSDGLTCVRQVGCRGGGAQGGVREEYAHAGWAWVREESASATGLCA
jgi:hypothetical protein